MRLDKIPTIYLFKVTANFAEQNSYKSILKKCENCKAGAFDYCVFAISNFSPVLLSKIPGLKYNSDIDYFPICIPKDIMNFAPKLKQIDGIIVSQPYANVETKRHQVELFSLKKEEKVIIETFSGPKNYNNVFVPDHNYWTFFKLTPYLRRNYCYFLPSENLQNERFYAIVALPNIYPFRLVYSTGN